jgi:hypothetical protein
MYRLWKILLMVRGLHDNCCANQTLLRPCRFSSALIASPMWGSSFIPLPFDEPRPQKATMKKAWKLFALPSAVDLLDYQDREASTKSPRHTA